MSQQAEEVQRQIAATLESVTDGFMRYDRDWRIVYANAEAERINRLTRDEMLGRTLWELFPAVVGTRFEAEFRRAMAERVTVEFENHYEPFGRWYSLKGYPSADGGLTTFIRDITEAKQTRQRLVDSEAESSRQRRLYETVLSNTPDLAYVFDLEHRFTYANQALLTMWGRSWEDAIGKKCLELGYEPWHAAMHDREIDQVVATRKPIRGEVAFTGTNGTRLYDYIFVPVIGANGEVEAVAGTTRDVTERKEAERRLLESEERSAFVRRSSGVGFWYCDLPFDVLEWDDLVKAHFHLPPDAIVTIGTFYDRIHPDDREPTREAIDRSIGARTQYDVDYRTVNPDTGAVTWVRAIGRTLYAADGTPKRFDGVTLDVSEQKRAEERRRLALDAAELGSWHIDPATNTLTTDERFRMIFAGTTDAMDYEQAFAAIHPDDQGRVTDAVAAATRVGDPAPFAEEYRVVHQDGSIRWVFGKGRANFGGGGSGCFTSFDGTVADITARKQIDDEREQLVGQLRDQDRRKDEFLATLAHELRNPLAPIRNGLAVMQRAGATGAIEQARAMMERQLMHLVRLVDDLLDMSRVTSGKLELRRETVELKAVVDAAVETSRATVEQAGHQLSVALPDEPILLHGDATRLTQVVANLLNNSAKYTHSGGHIRLHVRRKGGMAVVSVADDGIGIPPGMLGKVFEMFTQVDRTLEKTTGGLGVGLSLVKGLVEMHGGTIEARSEGEGRGSEFIVQLPVMAVGGHAAAPQVGAIAAGPSGRRRILVADDNVDSAASLAELLQLLGNEVSTANDGLQAVGIAETFRPDVVLMDIAMPRLNGYEACRRIREQPFGKHTLVVAMTGWGQVEDQRKSQDAGFDHHLVKPVDPAMLQKLLSSLKAGQA